MKSIIIILVFLFVSVSYAQDTSMTNKQFQYTLEKKSPTTAIILSLLLPSAGHIYTGNAGVGLAFLGGELICLYLAIEELEYQSRKPNDRSDLQLYGGLVGFVGLRIWEIIDASNSADRYNNELYKKIFNKEKSVSLKYLEKGKLLRFEYNF